MKRFAILIFTILLVFVASAADYLSLVEEADKAIEASDWNRADSLLVSAMQLEPTNESNVMLLSNVGMLRFYAGRDSAAIEALNEAHRIVPRSTTILANRATVYLGTGRYAEAMNDYNAILQLDSLNTDARFNRGILLLRSGDPVAAATDILLLDSIAPGSFHTDVAMGALLSATGRYEDAAIRYSHVIDLDPQPDYYAARALCYLMTDRLADASSDIAAGLEMDPEDGELYLYRAVLNKMRYRPDDAEADARRAIALGVDPKRATSFF